MQDKIELYKDILLSDPFSRVFYPLSIALKEQGSYEESAHYLEQGLLYHTNFLEARMLFVEVLDTLGNIEKRDAEIDKIIVTFKKYPSFWRVCATKEHEHNDVALALQFVSQALTNTDVTLSKVFASGLQALSPLPTPINNEQEYSSTEHVSVEIPLKEENRQEYKEPIDEELSSIDEITDITYKNSDTNINTRSMADLLAEQGELEKALAIYKELLEKEQDIEVKAELKFIIQEFEARIKEEGTAEHVQENTHALNKENLINTLATLVSRLDARAEAIQTQI